MKTCAVIIVFFVFIVSGVFASTNNPISQDSLSQNTNRIEIESTQIVQETQNVNISNSMQNSHSIVPVFKKNILKNPVDAIPKKWIASLEIGSGNIVGLIFGRALSKSIDAGLGTGFDAYNQTIGEQKYSTLFLNGNIFGLNHIVDKNGIDISGRLQLGYNILKVGKNFSTKSFDLTPAVLTGYKNVYAILSGVCMLTKEFTFVPQIGIGYRFEF